MDYVETVGLPISFSWISPESQSVMKKRLIESLHRKERI